MPAAEQTAHEARLAKLAGQTARIQRLRSHPQANVERMVNAVKRAGAQPILIISPVLYRDYVYPDEALDAPVLNFADPRLAPEILRAQYRADDAHLTPEGARIYTDEAARRFLDLARAGARR